MSFHADIENIQKMSDKVTGDYVQRVADVKAKVDAAEVPAISWGIIGQPVAWTMYRSMVEDFQEYLALLNEGTRTAGERLRECAENYHHAELTGARIFTDLENSLSNVRPPSIRKGP